MRKYASLFALFALFALVCALADAYGSVEPVQVAHPPVPGAIRMAEIPFSDGTDGAGVLWMVETYSDRVYIVMGRYDRQLAVSAVPKVPR